LVIPGTILKYAIKGKLPLVEKAMQAFQELQSGDLKPVDASLPFLEFAIGFLENCKKTVLLICGQAMQKFQQKIQEEQEVLSRLADMITQVYMLEGVILRTIKTNTQNREIREAITKVFISSSTELLKNVAKEVIFATAQEDIAITTLKSTSKLLQLPPTNTIAYRKKIAQHFIQENQYRI